MQVLVKVLAATGTVSVAAVRFSPVQGHIFLNPEPDHWSGSGKSLNLNLNLPERVFRSGSGFGEVQGGSEPEPDQKKSAESGTCG